MDKMKLWQEVFVTDPSAVKAITGKPYKGHSPKPYWLIQRATEVFGPCGQGWGVEVKSEGFHRMTETDVMHSAVVTVWYMQDGNRCAIEQMGQTKACYKKADGGMMLDEDAGKKSVTDGMVKCLSMIGFAGDIFSGQWDDSKYVEWASAETARRTAKADPGNAQQREEWIAGRIEAIAAAKTVGDLKKLMDEALLVVRDERDQDAEDRLIEASAAKVAKAKKPVIANPPSHDAVKARQLAPVDEDLPY